MWDVELFCDLSHVSFWEPAPQWLLSGDFHQYLSFFNALSGPTLLEAIRRQRSPSWLGWGNRVTLTECRRSDEQLFAFYASLIPGGMRRNRPLKDNVAEARRMFPGFIPGTALAPTNLVLCHKLCVELNALCNTADARGREGVVAFTLQDYYTSRGAAAVGCAH